MLLLQFRLHKLRSLSSQFLVSFRCWCKHEHPPEGSENDPEKQGAHSAGITEYPWQQHPLLHPSRQPPTGHLAGRHRAKDQVQEEGSRWGLSKHHQGVQDGDKHETTHYSWHVASSCCIGQGICAYVVLNYNLTANCLQVLIRTSYMLYCNVSVGEINHKMCLQVVLFIY